MGQIICFDMGQFYVKPYSGENAVTVAAGDQLVQMAGVCNRLTPVCGLTDDEIECAKLERELDAARKDGLIVLYEITSPHVNSGEWLISMTPARVHHGKTKLEVLQSAAEFVRSLRESKLPEPDDMDYQDLMKEITIQRGAIIKFNGNGADCPAVVANDGRSTHTRADTLNGLRIALGILRKWDAETK